LISHLLLFKKGSRSSSLIPRAGYGTLLPDNATVDALSAILWLSHILLAARINADTLSVHYIDGKLEIRGKHLYLAKEQLRNIVLPKNLIVVFQE
jgi:hypothetical protein